MTERSSSSTLRGILWMIVTGLMFVGVTSLVKYLGPDMPAAEAAFLRYALGLVLLVPMLGSVFKSNFSQPLMRLFVYRGVAHVGAVFLWFFAMARIPLADVTAMNYLSPIYVTLGAALFLGEKLALRRVIAVGIALVGALIILRPGIRSVDMGHLAMLLAAVFFACSYLLTKRLSDQTSAGAIVVMLSLFVTLGLGADGMDGLGSALDKRFAYPFWCGLLCHIGALHDDAGLCRSAREHHATGYVFTAGLGGVGWDGVF